MVQFPIHPRGRPHALVTFGLVALLLALAAGCGTPSTGSTSTPPAPTATTAPAATDTPAPPTATPNPNQASVHMSGAIGSFKFNPASITIKVGTAVVWTNSTGVAHTATSDPSSAVSWDSGLVSPGSTFTFTFTRPGTYTYHCNVHPSMTGTIVVTS